jgi:hypothetical protein
MPAHVEMEGDAEAPVFLTLAAEMAQHLDGHDIESAILAICALMGIAIDLRDPSTTPENAAAYLGAVAMGMLDRGMVQKAPERPN